MTDLTRRTFLRGALSLAALSAAPVAVMARLAVPTIYGDLIHDDTDGLQAALDGRPFIVEGTLVEGGAAPHLQRGAFLISRTLRVTRPRTFINQCHFRAVDGVDTFLSCESDRTIISECYFDTGLAPMAAVHQIMADAQIVAST